MKTFKEYLNNIYLVEMAQKQGSIQPFIFYTFDNEYISHYPHIHICVKADSKDFNGKILKSNKKLKTIGSIKIRADCDYTIDNIEFETLFDNTIDNNHYKKIFIDWLKDHPFKKLKDYTNSDKCLIDYNNSNERYLDKDTYIKRINNIGN